MTIDASWRVAAVAATLHAARVESVREAIDAVGAVLDERACQELLRQYADVEPRCGDRVDDHMPAELRRRAGAFFTPPALADRLVELALGPTTTGRVIDLSCGDGALLAACVEHADVDVVGVEREIVFALAAALRLRNAAARVIWGDGLELRPELRGCAAIVGNPPYVGEKGNRALFAEVREAHPDLAQHFAPRIDLHYLFIHRALDYLRAGGRLAYLTSEYWLTATGAGNLRRDLAQRSHEHVFEQLGAGAFASAPGQHSLLFAARRASSVAAGDDRTWHPFATTKRLASGTPLGELVTDRQGFVSGVDRTTARLANRYDVAQDAPVFIWRADEVPDRDRDLFRPLVRRSDCVANAVMNEPPNNDFVLWCDGLEDDETMARLKAYLEPFRAVLEARREVEQGTMPWTRIWWPRQTAEYARPKLVVPRRAKAPRFCLDLSGSHVSSDCTFLLAPDDVSDEISWLVRVMLAANSTVAAEQLRAFGKTKGEIMEFYSAPLRAWRLPVVREEGALKLADEMLEERAHTLRREIG